MVFSSWVCSSTSASLHVFMVARRAPASHAPCAGLLSRTEGQTVPGISAIVMGAKVLKAQGTLELLARPAIALCPCSLLRSVARAGCPCLPGR